jgi:hypothetical protein
MKPNKLKTRRASQESQHTKDDLQEPGETDPFTHIRAKVRDKCERRYQKANPVFSAYMEIGEKIVSQQPHLQMSID